MSGSLCCSQSAPFALADCRNTTLTKTEAIQLQSPPKRTTVTCCTVGEMQDL